MGVTLKDKNIGIRISIEVLSKSNDKLRGMKESLWFESMGNLNKKSF